MEPVTTEIQELRREIERRLPGATVTVDAPHSPQGWWWIDVESQGDVAAVEWRPNVGFGVAAHGGAYGEGPDDVFADAALAAEYVSDLLRTARRGVR